MVCHFGALVDEAPFEVLLGSNFIGSYNIWESAKINKVKRIIYASSIHAVGMYSKTETLTSKSLHNPDSFYGLGKCFSEDLRRHYSCAPGLQYQGDRPRLLHPFRSSRHPILSLDGRVSP